ncbi:S8 family peptidase [Yersinia aleksiciae]|uniref:S8 family peptidase n=1 Tax=Yersinia aleksiciae TaxID=263819 RepID=UPI0011A68483|nr:S8 family peptidase [Yersinia aleksiciae]
MKNFIIGYGEALTTSVEIKSGGGGKNHPYTLSEGRQRLKKGLSEIISDIQNKPDNECANGEVVIKLIQHPSYLAKSYYPKPLFKKFGIRDVGSRSVLIKPDKWAVQKHPDEAVAACIYVAGKKENFSQMLTSLASGQIDDATLKSIRTIEKAVLFESKEKVKSIINQDGEKLRIEVVIHASKQESWVLHSFEKFLLEQGGEIEKHRIKITGGLTFAPVIIDKGNEETIAKFSHLRALRSVPKLRFNKPDAVRQVVYDEISLPIYQPLSNDFKVCILDGGLGDNHLLTPWANEIIPNDIKTTSPNYLSHGGEVCSTYLFGPYNMEKGAFGTPYTNVDVVRVISPDDNDPDLFDVLSRIESILIEKKYKYINLSLGPQIPVDDDDVHVWTSVLDKYLQDGSCLATVAIGNDGDLKGEYSRIQPPSDMVNCLAIGACDTTRDSWQRAHYSCTGPGRSPGIVKPDGMMFGGDRNNLFHVYSPRSGQLVGTLGTSFASPYALRVAAGIDAITDFNLKTTTIRALMVHNAHNPGHDMVDVGWGRFPDNPETIVECLDDEATIIFQGELLPSQHLRIPVPLPNNIECTWVHLKATFCINAVTDPEHPLNYTQNGLEITFRPNNAKFTPKKGKISEHPDTVSFFSCSELYKNEQELREDAHKWETCISRERRFKLSTLKAPMFDVKYHSREQGGPASSDLEPIKYSLILSIKAKGDSKLYNSLLQQYQTLQAIKVTNRIRT